MDYLDCVNTSYGEYLTCLAADVDCDAGVIESCMQEHDGKLATCTQVGAATRQTFIACY